MATPAMMLLKLIPRSVCLKLLAAGLCFSSLSVQASAERVISLSPHLTELAYAAGMGDKLIAASDYSDYPQQAKKLERVASWQGLNLERILALKPDLVLSWRGGNPQKSLDQMTHLGLNIFYSDPNSIHSIADNLIKLAEYSPHPEQAHAAAADILAKRQALKDQYARPGKPPVNVFLQFSTQPLFSTSGTTIQSEVVSLCGGHNIFADSPVPWPQVSREQVLTRKPQAIIISGNEAQVKIVKTFWHGQLDVPVITVPENWFNRSGPRIMLAAEVICQKLSQISSTS